MEMRRRQLVFLGVMLLAQGNLFAAPNNTMSITPAATSGSTITASDENSRNNEISSKYNAHTHTDISATANTLNIGDGTAGNKNICDDATTDRCIRWDDTNNLWTAQQFGTTYNEIAVYSGVPGSNGLFYSNGSGGLLATAALTNGQVVIGSTGAAPVPAALTAGTGITITNAAGSITIATTAALSVFKGEFTRDTSTASGTQAVTGVGFTPRVCFYLSSQINAVGEASIGFDTGSTQGVLDDAGGSVADTWSVNTTDAVLDVETGANQYAGNATSMDADGFTFTWTRTGTPTGTITIEYVCLR